MVTSIGTVRLIANLNRFVFCFGLVVFVSACSTVNAQITANGDFNEAYDGTSDPWLVGGDVGGDGFGDSSLDLFGSPNVTSLTIEGGSEVSNQTGRIASIFSGTAGVTVTGAGSQWNNALALRVGSSGEGSLNIENGGSVTNTDASIGDTFNLNSVGTVVVDGAGSTWTNSGSIGVGNVGTGSLTISNGGVVSSAGGSLTSLVSPEASQNPSSAAVTISGAGSTWNNSGDLAIGNDTLNADGDVQFNLQSGGKLSVGGTMKIWDDGLVTVSGGSLEVAALEFASAAATANFDFQGGELSVDSVVGDLIQNGGVLAPGDSPGLTEIDGNYTFNDGTIQIELGGLDRVTEFDAINVTGNTLLNNVTIEVSFIDGFAASVLDEFDIFDGIIDPASTITFDFTNAPLSGLQTWDTDSFLTNGIISAIPEPSGAMIVIVTGTLIATRRRKALI